MPEKLCLMHANCQGDELERLLLASPAFAGTFRLKRYTNYIREPVPEAELAGCDVFLYQHLGEQWNELSSAALLARLSPSATALLIPNMLFKGYWPFWTPHSPIAFGDALLNRLIDEGAPKPVILRIYLHGDLGSFIDLKEAFEESVAVERSKEAGACVGTVDFVLASWKRRPLFHTINHPGRDLLIHVADGILAALGLPPLAGADLAPLGGGFPSYDDFDLPIHPGVAAFHGLAFAGPERGYRIFSRELTFAQYVSRYIDCRRGGFEDDFLSYLALV